MFITCECGGDVLVQESKAYCFRCQSYKGEQSINARCYELTDYLEEAAPVEEVIGAYKIPLLDAKLFGLKPGNLVILSGKSGNGKTLVATHIAIRAALQGLAVVYLTTDMPITKLMHRFRKGIGYGTKMDQASFLKNKIFFMDLITQSYNTDVVFEEFGKLLKYRQIDCKLIVVDDLDSFGEDDTDSGVRYRASGKLLKTLRQLGSVLGAHVLALSQVNQFGELSESQRKKHKTDAVIEVSLPAGSSEITLTIKKNRDGSFGEETYFVRQDFLCLEGV